ncbi:hypothetical protein TNCV_3370581 [Trichonephila clavipes]|nr:hypothetical protein TNCV_3370581 [Trichonephila clavipes]
MFLSMGYALPLLQRLLLTVFPYAAPNCSTVLDITSGHSSVSICFSCWCSPKGVIVAQGVSPSHPTHVLWDLRQRTLAKLRCRPRHLTMVQNDVVRRQRSSCS